MKMHKKLNIVYTYTDIIRMHTYVCHYTYVRKRFVVAFMRDTCIYIHTHYACLCL